MLAEGTDEHGKQLTSAVRTFIMKPWHFPGTTVFDEETVRPEKLTKAPENAGIDPSTMKMKKWHLEPTREDDDPHFPSSSRVSDALTGADSHTRYESLSNMTKGSR